MYKFVIVLIAATCAYGLPKDVMSRGLEGRIVGGQKAVLGQFPYQAELSLNKEHQCGGTILNNKWVVTAAHCVRGYAAAQFVLKVGTTTLDAGGDIYYLDKIVMHESYDITTKQNDVALVRVSTEIKFTDNVQPLPVADYVVPDGADVVVSGWGYTSWVVNPSTPNDLYFINLKTMAYAQCGLNMIWWGTVTEDQICTYTRRGEGVCGGDSGGPLVHEGHLVGIVSWGIPCGAGSPDIYAKGSAYLDWIKITMWFD